MMRRVGVLLVAVLAVAGAVASDEAPKSITLNGEYAWDQGGAGGDLEAVFTPTGDGAWNVAFHFTFQGEPHTYTGTAAGSLETGELSGEVFNENGRRSWEFEGGFSDGTFEGVHTETTGGTRTRTGTLTLAG